MGAKLEIATLGALSGPTAHLGVHAQLQEHLVQGDRRTTCKAVGAQHFIISTDLGQTANPSPPDGLAWHVAGADVAGDHEGADPDDGAREPRETVDGLAAGNAEVGVGRCLPEDDGDLSRAQSMARRPPTLRGLRCPALRGVHPEPGPASSSFGASIYACAGANTQNAAPAAQLSVAAARTLRRCRRSGSIRPPPRNQTAPAVSSA